MYTPTTNAGCQKHERDGELKPPRIGDTGAEKVKTVTQHCQRSTNPESVLISKMMQKIGEDGKKARGLRWPNIPNIYFTARRNDISRYFSRRTRWSRAAVELDEDVRPTPRTRRALWTPASVLEAAGPAATSRCVSTRSIVAGADRFDIRRVPEKDQTVPAAGRPWISLESPSTSRCEGLSAGGDGRRARDPMSASRLSVMTPHSMP